MAGENCLEPAAGDSEIEQQLAEFYSPSPIPELSTAPPTPAANAQPHVEQMLGKRAQRDGDDDAGALNVKRASHHASATPAAGQVTAAPDTGRYYHSVPGAPARLG